MLCIAEEYFEPLVFCFGRFSETKCGWSSLEKEAYDFLGSITRVNWLATCADGFDLYNDHKNLIIVFNPISLQPYIGEVALHKVMRWTVWFLSYNFVCLLILSEDNVLDDLLDRWAFPLTIIWMVSISPLPTTSHYLDCPSVESIKESQQRHESTRPKYAVLVNDLWRLPGPRALPGSLMMITVCNCASR